MRKEIINHIKEFGHHYETEGTAYFFYSLIKFKHCKNFLELGTGFGVTAFAVAEAMKENNRGTITSYDKANDSFIKEKIKDLDLNNINFINEEINFNQIKLTNLDIIFSDFDRTPVYIQDLITFFLLNSNPYSSLFVDGLNSYWPGYSYLTQMINLLNEQKIPCIFKEVLNEQNFEKIKNKIYNTRFTQINIRKKDNDKEQNGLIWIKQEPYYVCPEPLKI
jgi:hypothetical protein